MRTYTFVTGIVFALLVIAHIARTAVEGLHVLRDPFLVASTLLSLGLSIWSVWLILGNRTRANQSEA